MKRILHAALLSMAVLALAGIGNLARAEPYPAKPIRFVAPYARMTSRPAYGNAMPPAGSEGDQPAVA